MRAPTWLLLVDATQVAPVAGVHLDLLAGGEEQRDLDPLAAASAVAVPALADTRNGGTATTVQCSGGTVALQGPTSLWPPNHKAVDEVLFAQSNSTTAPLQPTSLDVMVTSNEAADEVGSGHTPVDIVVGKDSDSSDATATVPFTVLAERSGTGTGRVYTVNWTAHFQDGSSCSSTMPTLTDPQEAPFTITVPHDQSNNAEPEG